MLIKMLLMVIRNTEGKGYTKKIIFLVDANFSVPHISVEKSRNS